MAAREFPFQEYAWPLSRLGELLENLARRAGLTARPMKLPQPPAGLLDAPEQTISAWMDNAAGHLGVEAEPVSVQYTEVEGLLAAGAPAILRLPGPIDENQPRFVALLKGGDWRVSILAPDLRVRRLPASLLRSALCYPYESYLGQAVGQLLSDARIPAERRDRARTAILREQLAPLRIEGGWMLRLSPGANLPAQFAQGGIYRPVAIMLGMYFVQILLSVASWYVIGRGIFQGRFDLGWLLAWAILLLSTVPVQLIVSDAQSELSMGAGAIFKQRLIFGALKLEPEEIRHQGMGQFLGRVMESEAVEMLAFSGGFAALLSFIEFGMALFILSKGAGGMLHAATLALWIAITLTMLWRYYRASRDWAEVYREMTNDLVERMVGHRSRLVQEDPHHWHDSEDETLDRYLKLSENLDRIGLRLNAFVTRGWLLVGLGGIALPFIASGASAQAVAISLGGVLLASQALGKLVAGAQSLVSLLNAWQQVRPLFRAASRPPEHADLGLVPGVTGLPAEEEEAAGAKPSPSGANGAPDGNGISAQASHPGQGQTLLMARDLVFRYRPQGKPVIQDVSLIIKPGERLLLEGPSGGGKSTLAALLTGLRKPESGSLLLWGYDRQIMGAEEWRRRVVMAPQFQENYVFSETFAFNLLMGRRWPPQPGDLEEAEAICRELNLGDLLERMPSGFQQMLGESGWQLSHGERSRLFIARTLLQQADLIVLDESFGALDPENLAVALQCVLNRAKTVLVIAHP